MRRGRFRTFVLAALVISFGAWTYADTGKNQKEDASELPYLPPKSPAEALKSFRVHPGFRVELAAAEPHLASPMALDFDEDGRLYVAEYPEYNQYASKMTQGRGRVRLLKDTDGDGVYDK